MNLLIETLNQIAEINKNISDITFIGTKDGKKGCSFESFSTMAFNDYDNSYGYVNVLEELVIVFKDKSYLERREYDGSEEWIHVSFIPHTLDYAPLTTIWTEEYE